MPTLKLLLLRSNLSARQCTSINSSECQSSLLSGTDINTAPSIAIILIAVASTIGLLLLIAYIRHAIRYSKQCHTSFPRHHDSSPHGSNTALSSRPLPNAPRFPRQPQSGRAKKSKFVDPPPAYAIENRSERVLERAPGLEVVPAAHDGGERARRGGEELLAPLGWRERRRDSAPAYSIDETLYSRDGPVVADAQSSIVVKVKYVGRSEAESEAGAAASR